MLNDLILQKNKWTALHWAADRDHLGLVELLLESGADPMLEGEVCFNIPLRACI